MKIVHAVGKTITYSERKENEYLQGKMWNHTKCGYLFDKKPCRVSRLTFDNDAVTCKLCLKLLKNEP